MFISVTRLRVRKRRFLLPFLWTSTRSALQARKSRGFISGALASDRFQTFWTTTAWEDEEAMRAYRIAEPHLTAMRRLPEWCDEASIAHWEASDATLPDFATALQRMIELGRVSKVNHPTADHAAGRIAADRRVPQGAFHFHRAAASA
jgi:heme-degrading monooxygenase HmoA